MARVADLLARKGPQVHTIAADATVYQAIEKMVQHNVGSLLIVDGEAIAGIFTERDYLRRIALQGRTSRTTQVREVMTSRLVYVEPHRSLEDCMAIMTQERIRHLPVMDGSRAVGMLSIGDLVRHLSQEQEVQIRYLTDYITGKYPA
jgi:CBS domain-containing protein